ncbi:hypothetical protein, partial [Stenotrophomonas maltophilia]|uniref:hypothetical protein n=2 Tax=Stenotrophomonas maltophilia TaxID=40324 RepID=UPI0019553B26
PSSSSRHGWRFVACGSCGRIAPMAADIAEFLRDPLVVATAGGVLVTVVYWTVVFALRKKGPGNGR